MRERLKAPREGSEIDPETVCLQSVGASLWGDGVPFEERACELVLSGEVNPCGEAVAKASPNRAL